MKRRLPRKHPASKSTPVKTELIHQKAVSQKSRKITADVPQSLLDAAARLAPASGQRLTTSALVRQAIEYFVEMEQARRLEHELEAGYLATADVSENIHRDFQYADAENS